MSRMVYPPFFHESAILSLLCQIRDKPISPASGSVLEFNKRPAKSNATVAIEWKAE
jgi:hypothetical protein